MNRSALALIAAPPDSLSDSLQVLLARLPQIRGRAPQARTIVLVDTIEQLLARADADDNLSV